MRFAFVFGAIAIAACSESSSSSSGGAGDASTSSSSSGSSSSGAASSSGAGSSGTTSSSGDTTCPPEPDGRQSTTFLPCASDGDGGTTGADGGTCSPLDLESKSLTSCSTTVFDVGWRPPNLTSEVCGTPSGASIALIGTDFCSLGAVSVPINPPAGVNGVQPVNRAAYLVQTKDGNRFVVHVDPMQSDGLAIKWVDATKLPSQ